MEVVEWMVRWWWSGERWMEEVDDGRWMEVEVEVDGGGGVGGVMVEWR